MNGPKRRQILLAAYLGLVVGSALVLAYVPGWEVGVPTAFLGLDSGFLFYAVTTHKKDRDPHRRGPQPCRD
jgi:hypothetical protein